MKQIFSSKHFVIGAITTLGTEALAYGLARGIRWYLSRTVQNSEFEQRPGSEKSA